MRYVNGQGVVKDNGCWLAPLSSSRVFPVIGKSGSPLLQPGESLGLDGRGLCVVDNSAASFRVRSVSSNEFWNCDGNWSVLRKRGGNYTTIYEQDASVWKLGLENFIRTNFTNPDNDEFWLFPTPTCDVGKTIVGNGGSPITIGSYQQFDDGTAGAPKSRGILTNGTGKFSVTVVIHSNTLQTQNALENNFLWDFVNGKSRNVFIPWYDTTISGEANLYPLELKSYVTAPGASSQTYGAVAVLSRSMSFESARPITVAMPIFRVHDLDSMFRPNYSDSSMIKIETIFQFATS